MNEFRVRATGAIITEQELRFASIHMLPLVIDADACELEEVDPVLVAPAPSITSSQTVRRNGVVQDGLGNWVYAWLVEDLTNDQVAAALVLAKTSFITQVDKDVDAIYASVIGSRATEYSEALAQAQEFAARDPAYSGEAPAYVASWAAAKASSKWTTQQAAEDIIATGAAWLTAANAIRSNRLLRKEQARVATNLAGVTTAKTQWNGFVAYILGQLGI